MTSNQGVDMMYVVVRYLDEVFSMGFTEERINDLLGVFRTEGDAVAAADKAMAHYDAIGPHRERIGVIPVTADDLRASPAWGNMPDALYRAQSKRTMVKVQAGGGHGRGSVSMVDADDVPGYTAHGWKVITT